MEFITEITAVSHMMDAEEERLQSMNDELDKQIEKDMEKIETYIIPDSPTKDPEKDDVDQDMDEEENIFQSMNTELDKQIAQDMEAIRNYISRNEDSFSKRIEFFNSMDSSYINKCVDRAVTNHILYQHTVLGTIKWHECTKCEYRAREESNLKEHMIEKHSNNSWLACPHCPFSVRRTADFVRHLKTVHKKDFEDNKCDKCGATFVENCHLLRHLKEKHDHIVFACEKCDFATANQGELSQHVVSQHLKLNFSWYKCAQCAYRTVKKANLDRHIMYKHSAFY